MYALKTDLINLSIKILHCLQIILNKIKFAKLKGVATQLQQKYLIKGKFKYATFCNVLSYFSFQWTREREKWQYHGLTKGGRFQFIRYNK